jgi:hypothetical protein
VKKALNQSQSALSAITVLKKVSAQGLTADLPMKTADWQDM